MKKTLTAGQGLNRLYDRARKKVADVAVPVTSGDRGASAIRGQIFEHLGTGASTGQDQRIFIKGQVK
jgi:hypothetical protein